MNLQPLASTETELPSYPLGHAVPDFFSPTAEMDYTDKKHYFDWLEISIKVETDFLSNFMQKIMFSQERTGCRAKFFEEKCGIQYMKMLLAM